MVLYIAMGIGAAFDARRGVDIRRPIAIRAPEMSAAATTGSRTGTNLFGAGPSNGDHPRLLTRNQTFCNRPTADCTARGAGPIPPPLPLPLPAQRAGRGGGAVCANLHHRSWRNARALLSPPLAGPAYSHISTDGAGGCLNRARRQWRFAPATRAAFGRH